MMPGPSQRLKFDVVLPGVLLGIAPGGGVDGEALYDKHVNLRIMRESDLIDFRDAGRDCHIGQIDAAVERLIFNTGDTLRDGDAPEVLAAVKGAMADFFDPPGIVTLWIPAQYSKAPSPISSRPSGRITSFSSPR